MKLALGCVLALSVVACKKEKPADSGVKATPGSAEVAPGSGSATGPATAGSGSGSAIVDDDPNAAEEAARRKGKKTGIADGEKPEVITEELLRAIGTGKTPIKRFIDPKLGVVERIHMPGATDKPNPDIKRTLCGATAETDTAKYLKTAVDAEAAHKSDDYAQLVCWNEFADKDDPDFGADEMGDKPAGAVVMKHVTCGTTSAGEYSEIAHVVWLPDAERGMRIAAIVSTEGGAITGKLWHEVATELKAAKPCK
ncbi:MAG: hypothetical protein ABI867_27325 [Kofleriaceae bacterium]